MLGCEDNVVCLVTFPKSQHNIAPCSSLGNRPNVNKITISYLHYNEFNFDESYLNIKSISFFLYDNIYRFDFRIYFNL